MNARAARRALAGALASLLLAPAGAAAKPQTLSGMHNARYCEILELRGTIPDAEVTIWNTIGLNNCPPEQWKAFDAAELAAERGATLVVLNGPRRFLMDSATAEPGRVHSFDGLEMRKVATIPIRTSADLAQTAYSERTVERHNTWRWQQGRRVFELLAPNGANYVMQSLSQIRDPELSIDDLRALGGRLELPAGWSYRVRRLKRDLVLRTRGEATIVQDELQNTYQRLPLKPATEVREVHVSGVTRTVGAPASGTLDDRGTVDGPPFGPGTIALLATFDGPQVSGSFEIEAARGKVFGTMVMGYTIEGSEITFRGTADLTGGTGRYRGITGEDLAAYDHNTLDGQSGTLTLDGVARLRRKG